MKTHAEPVRTVARANGHKSGALGMDMDRAEWAKVRALWQVTA